jgi:glycosyltransferase involved in cell wall biosynthesis
MRILVNEAEFDFKANNKEINKRNGIDSNTSVNDVKAHFFETLEEIGTIIKISNNIQIRELQNLCNQVDVIFASFHEEPPIGIACRLLKHTKGSLMLTGGFLNRWTFMKTTMNIVTSHQQAIQLTKGLGKSAPLISTFISRMNTNDFRLPSKIEKIKAKKSFDLNEETFHLIFGGRFIANKGIAQIVRTLNLWPQKNIRLTLVGNFEQDFFIYQSNATHATFPNFFEREILVGNKNVDIVCLPSMKHHELRNLFWSADCFVFPSFHEDEAIGTTPRLAMLCGVPVIATDFSGFGQLKETNTSLLKTYATLGGVRFSLYQLLKEIIEIRNWSKEEKSNNTKFNSGWLLEFSNTEKSKNELKIAIEQLLKIPVGEAPEGGWRSRARFDKWINSAPKIFKEVALKAEEKQFDGLYVDGAGYAVGGWFSEPHFLKTIQSIHTTFPDVPKARINNTYRGFWRLSLLESENAAIEFGFPGPRVLRFNQTEFELLKSCTTFVSKNDILFQPKEDKQLIVIQKMLELGYLVPDDF